MKFILKISIFCDFFVCINFLKVLWIRGKGMGKEFEFVEFYEY